MIRLLLGVVSSCLVLLASGCASKSDYVLPDEARKLSADEIVQAFSNTREAYEALDDPGLTARITYTADGGFFSEWKKGWFFDGRVEGRWYTENDQLCVKTTTKVDGADLFCTRTYEMDGVYTAVHPDGRYQAISTLTPLGELMSSAQIREVFIGNTIQAAYPDHGEMIDVWEYNKDDGTTYGLDGKHGDYTATWEIRDSGCFYGDYSDNKYDGCYFYVHDSGNQYRYHRPWSDEIGHAVVLEGNPKQLNGKSDS